MILSVLRRRIRHRQLCAIWKQDVNQLIQVNGGKVCSNEDRDLLSVLHDHLHLVAIENREVSAWHYASQIHAH